MRFDTTADAFAWLDAHVNLESLGVPVDVPRRIAEPTLERMEGLAALLGSPQLEYPVIHITGTNGKTTVARLTSALLVAHGISTGMYTSPNLERINERIVWDGEEISDDALAELLGAHRRHRAASLGGPELLRDHDRRRVPVLRRRRGRRGGGRGRSRRSLGRDQRRGRPHRRGDERLDRPRRVPRARSGIDRHREGGDRETGCGARPRRDRPGTRVDLRGPRSGRRSWVAIATSV